MVRNLNNRRPHLGREFRLDILSAREQCPHPNFVYLMACLVLRGAATGRWCLEVGRRLMYGLGDMHYLTLRNYSDLLAQ